MNGKRQFVIYFLCPMLLLIAVDAFAIRVDLNNQTLHRTDDEKRQEAVQRLMSKSHHLELRMVAI